MTKRILAMTLCLALTLLACACAASNVTVSAPESTDNKGDSSTDLSTMEQPDASTPVAQTSSQPATSDEESKPTEPIIPEERETTLEKVLSFEIGEGGLFEYVLQLGESSERNKLLIPNIHCVDENGNLYLSYTQNQTPMLYCANTGESVVVENHKTWSSMIATEGTLFLAQSDGSVREYTMDGFVKEYDAKLFDAEGTRFETSIRFNADGTPVVRVFGSKYYALDGSKSATEKLPILKSNDQRGTSVTIGDALIDHLTQDVSAYYAFMFGKKLFLEEHLADQTVVMGYDTQGNLLFNFSKKYSNSNAKEVVCNIVCANGTLKTYTPKTIQIDGFSADVASAKLFYGADGNAYLITYYPDHADLYRINPGYSDVTFT